MRHDVAARPCSNRVSSDVASMTPGDRQRRRCARPVGRGGGIGWSAFGARKASSEHVVDDLCIGPNVSPELSGSGRDDGGAGHCRVLHDDHALGAALCARVRTSMVAFRAIERSLSAEACICSSGLRAGGAGTAATAASARRFHWESIRCSVVLGAVAPPGGVAVARGGHRSFAQGGLELRRIASAEPEAGPGNPGKWRRIAQAV